ncbi:MAG: sucrase ferredoxin [Pseudonocardiaceae bacterium]
MSRCAELAESAADPLEASAPPAARWVLVEHPGPWGRRALSGSGLDRDVATALGSWADLVAGRVALIRRRASAHRAGSHRRWFVVDSRPGHESVRSGSYVDERELVDVIDDPSAGEPVDPPLYLVCTHGRHDTCCAVRGRPVAAALAAEYPERTWECTHVGGDRFAANLVVLPHGLYYGHLPPGSAVDVARRHDEGLLDPRWLRGRSSLPAAVQAAQHHARRATGECGVDAFAPQKIESTAAGEWLVRLAGADGELAVRVRERIRDSGRPLTCAAVSPGRIRTYDLVALTS